MWGDGSRHCTRIHELNDVCGVIVAGTVLVFINIMVCGDGGGRNCTRIHTHNGVWGDGSRHCARIHKHNGVMVAGLYSYS